MRQEHSHENGIFSRRSETNDSHENMEFGPSVPLTLSMMMFISTLLPGRWSLASRWPIWEFYSGAPGTVICIQQVVNMSLLTIIAIDNHYWAHNVYRALWRRTLRGFLLLFLTGIWRNHINHHFCMSKPVQYWQFYVAQSNNLIV